MGELNPLKLAPLDSSKSFFIGICLTNLKKKQLHSYAIYRLDGELFKGEMGWQNIIGKEKFDQGSVESFKHPDTYFWVLPDLPEETLHNLASALDEILDTNRNGVSYSIIPPDNVVFKAKNKGKWFKKEGHGLTCATLILALFKYQNIPFIDASTWKSRPQDKKWIDRILNWLEPRHNEHVNAQKKILIQRKGKIPRVRPSDITTAARIMNVENTPLKFEDIDQLAMEIEKKILLLGKNIIHSKIDSEIISKKKPLN